MLLDLRSLYEGSVGPVIATQPQVADTFTGGLAAFVGRGPLAFAPGAAAELEAGLSIANKGNRSSVR